MKNRSKKSKYILIIGLCLSISNFNVGQACTNNNILALTFVNNVSYDPNKPNIAHPPLYVYSDQTCSCFSGVPGVSIVPYGAPLGPISNSQDASGSCWDESTEVWYHVCTRQNQCGSDNNPYEILKYTFYEKGSLVSFTYTNSAQASMYSITQSNMSCTQDPWNCSVSSQYADTITISNK